MKYVVSVSKVYKHRGKFINHRENTKKHWHIFYYEYDEIDEIDRIKTETREVNLNGDNKRFWLNRLENINDKKLNKSFSLNAEFYPNDFKLNLDYNVD